jgi:DNA-binding GntR family transcriptional regulator
MRADTVSILRTSTLKQDIARLMREAILSGKLRPGERINESKLARQWGVTRIPVRDALQELLEQGLVEEKPRRGMFLVELTEEHVQKINSLRIVLEGEALRLCSRNITPEGKEELGTLVDRMENYKALDDFEAASIDVEFHRTIWHYSGNEYLEKVLNKLVVPLFAHRVLWRITHDEIKWAKMLSHHRRLLQFVQGISEQSAEAVMLEHLSLRYNNPARFSSYAPFCESPSISGSSSALDPIPAPIAGPSASTREPPPNL